MATLNITVRFNKDEEVFCPICKKFFTEYKCPSCGLPKDRIDWYDQEAYCPICKKAFTGWYCPSCGLPKANDYHSRIRPRRVSDNIYCFRCGFKKFENFQLCHKCHTANPYNAKYCRSCGERIDLQAIDKNNHGWVDLGLSVLWSTDHINYAQYFQSQYFQWNGDSADLDDLKIDEFHDNLFAYYKDSTTYRNDSTISIYKNDPATIEWGEKWRTPTKEEFEELVIKCKWEKCLHPESGKHALKATGPNGNSIFLPVTGMAGMDNDEINGRDHSFWGGGCGPIIHEARYSHCFYWTSSEFNKSMGFAFSFIGYKLDFIPYVPKPYNPYRLREPWETREYVERRIQEDNEKRKILWLDTPVEMHNNTAKKAAFRSVVRPQLKFYGFLIRPVADKKWQGKL